MPQNEMQDLRDRVSTVERRVGELDRRQHVADTQSKADNDAVLLQVNHVLQAVDNLRDAQKSIQGDTRWIVRLIIGTFVIAVIGYFLKYGGSGGGP